MGKTLEKKYGTTQSGQVTKVTKYILWSQ